MAGVQGAIREAVAILPGIIAGEILLHAVDAVFVEEEGAVAIQCAFAGQGNIVGILGIEKAHAGVADEVVLQIGAGQEASFFFDQESCVAEELENAGDVGPRRNAKNPTPGFPAGVAGLLEGAGIERAAISDGPEGGNIERVHEMRFPSSSPHRCDKQCPRCSIDRASA